MHSCEDVPCLADIDCDRSRCENGKCGPPNRGSKQGNVIIAVPVFLAIIASMLI